MKRYIFILITVLIALSLNAQVQQEVIASAGGYNVNGDLSISWTLGETIIPTFTSQDGTLILTHGFQQQLIITAEQENLAVLVNLKVFPNPSSDFINIQFDSPLDGEVNIYIIDSQGRLIKTDIVEPSMVDKQINLQDVPAGIYYLRLTKGKLVNVYKVIKL
jgi:Secretion system C-terminal sorting domain